MTVFSQSRTIPVPVDEAFAHTVVIPLPTLFNRRFAALPPIKSVDFYGTQWGPVGQSRIIHLSDGGSMREEATIFDPSHEFGYELSEFKGAFKPLVTKVEGLWQFAPAGTGTKVTWEWNLTPAGMPGRLAMPAFGRMWQGYARQALEQLSHELIRRHAA